MTETAAVKTLRELFEGIRDESRMYANSATRIGNAFLSLLSYLVDDTPYLRKDREDGTNFLLRLFAGCIIGDNKILLDADGTISADKIKNVGTFSDGMFGQGYALWQDIDKNTHMTVDHLTVRQRMVIKELIIDKIRSIGGQIVVSAANGKIKTVHRDEHDFTISFEKANQFRAHDLIRCAQFNGQDVRDYWVEVKDSNETYAVIPVSEFPEGVTPKVGDDCVLMGNTADAARQNIIVLSATEDGQPRLDVMNNICNKNFADTLRARLGCLDGIHDEVFPKDKQPNGYGLYSDNVFLKGTFLLENGEDVKTRFEVTDGKIRSAVESVRHDIAYDENILDNPDFSALLTNWDTDNKAAFFLLGTTWIWANDNVLADRGDYSRVEMDGDRKVAHIHNNFIKQFNRNFLKKPEFEKDPETGRPLMVPIYLSFFYKCTKAGKLTANFSGADVPLEGGDGFFYKQENIAVTDKYEQFTYTGLWNGTGDFRIAFTGDILISMLVLTTDKTEGLAYKYRTLFEQSDRLVRLSAGIYDKNEECLKESGIVIKPEGSGMYAQDADGNLALVGVTVTKEGKSVIMLTADNIQLEGLVTANNNFKILTDGSIEANNGKFTGKITCTEGSIGGFNIGKEHLGMEAAADSDTFGNLSLYKDFFRIGGTDGIVMLGNNVASAAIGGKSTGRIVNYHINPIGYNYGLTIEVGGGKRNFGISSNAALKAPSMITTKAAEMTLNGGEYNIDLAQNNVLLLKATVYSNLNLPTEEQLATQFGETSLSHSFAMLIYIKVRTGSEGVILKNVYNSNNNIIDQKMSAGDSVILLASKADGFRYDIINLQN